MNVREIIHPRVDEGYCKVCCDYRKDICVICYRCENCGHKQTCRHND